jgi:phage regulator Rha-like protein
MTKNGFMFLVMGFTVAEAARVKEAFIGAFDQMATIIKGEYRSLMQQLFDAHEQDQLSRERPSVGSYAMLKRKSEKPSLESAVARLVARMQLSLPFEE